MESFADYRLKGDRLVDSSLRESAAQQAQAPRRSAPSTKTAEPREFGNLRQPAATDGLADGSMSVSWSHWSRCESSFSMLLVPHRPGVLALAEEVLAPQSGKRMLALFFVSEARDLSLAISELFASHSLQREALEQRRCFLRYAMISDPENRHAIAEALTAWMATQTQTATGIVRAPQPPAAEFADCDPGDCTQPPRAALSEPRGVSFENRSTGPTTGANDSASQTEAHNRLAPPAFPAGF